MGYRTQPAYANMKVEKAHRVKGETLLPYFTRVTIVQLPDLFFAMQSSFRSCKWPGPINLLLAAGTDNLLAGSGFHDNTTWGSLVHKNSGLLLFADRNTPEPKNVIIAKIFRDIFA